MIPNERRQEILDILNQKGYATVEDLAARLFVSTPTIRRDLQTLEKEGALRRNYGGASPATSHLSLEPTAYRSRMNPSGKRFIGQLASTLIKPGDSIFLDSGSTCLNIAYAIRDIPDLHILTNGLMSVDAMAHYENVTMDIPGGNFDLKHTCIVGAETEDYISRRHARIAFVSCSGLEASSGATAVYEKDIGVKKRYFKNSDQRVLLMDHDKFDKVKYYHVFDFNDFDTLICDKRPTDYILRACFQHNIEILWE